MKTLVLNFVKHILLCLFLFSFINPSFASSEENDFCSIDCIGQINHSLSLFGSSIITPSMLVSASNSCTSTLEVHIMDGNGIDIGNVVNCSHVGQNLMVSVVDPVSGNSCWGNILIEDKLKPEITCNDITIACNEDISPTNIGFPVTQDNCGLAGAPTFVDEIIDLECTDPQFVSIIKRKWSITDLNGNTNSCVQQIFLERADIDQTVFPPMVILDCNNPNTNPSNTGVPMINGSDIGGFCQLMFIPNDLDSFTTCGGGYKIIREWLVIDWCTNEIIKQNQLIEVQDTTPPVITCPADITYNTTSNACSGNIALNPPTVTDDCSDFTITTDFDFPQVGNIYTNVPTGTHPVTYTVTDECGNAASCSYNVTIKDNTSPIAVCDNPTQVSIGSNGFAKVLAITFDDGSTDNCGIDTFLVRRMDDPNFSDCVFFDCNDVGDTVMVVLQVIDECGNTNECMVEALVEDKIPPMIICPDDKTIECISINNFSSGAPIVSDNCGSIDTLFFVDDSTSFNTCNSTGMILREWTVIDNSGLVASCIQKITVEDNAEVIFNFPEDDTISCTTPYDPDISGRAFATGGCNDIVGFIADSLRLPKNDCEEKLFILWAFFDNCADTVIMDTMTQIIFIQDLAPPQITCPDTVRRTDLPTDCEQLVAFGITAFDSCSEIDTVINDFGNTLLQGVDTIRAIFPVGDTCITFTAIDICGNESTCKTVVEVNDITAPLINCGFIDINVALEFNQEIKLDVASLTFDNNSGAFFTASDECSPNLTYEIDQSSINAPTVSCDDIAANGGSITDFITITAIDGSGNPKTCLDFQINFFCSFNLMVAGVIQNEYGDNLEEVEVNIETNMMDMTDQFGVFHVDNLVEGNDYTIAPENNNNPRNGVNTVDLVLISKHILGIELLDSPYKIIAADANNSGTLTALDLSKIKSLILHMTDEFSNNTSWRFVDAAYEFDDPTQPLLENFPESMDCLNISESEVNMHFIGIKVGDVNGTAIPNNIMDVETRTDEDKIQLWANNILLKKDETYEVPIFAKNLNDILGFQYTLNFNPSRFEVIQIKNGILNEKNFGRKYIKNGTITCSWFRSSQMELLDENPLFYLKIKAKNTDFLQNNLWLNSNLTVAEGYNIKNKIHGIDLLFEKNHLDLYPNSDNVILFQNQPNPFSTSTDVKYYLPFHTNIELQISNLSGKVLYDYRTSQIAGLHTLPIDGNIFPSSGVYLYQLTTPSISLSRKMVVVVD